ncbi:hypothetical protein [Halodesulfovibrio sp.]|uniref:hypothetical protein n=1 Tax=Halodesulfovibrio sp. TaxID=1912772 RepID=UPI0025C4DAE8|nr:hypothetical protein [Halodesulfovibrio sp.]
MKRFLIISCFVSLLFIVGCGAKPGSSTYDYAAPNIEHIKNKKTINMPFAKAWDKLVGQLSESYFVINNIDKESRIINISFSSNNAGKYIDCGTSHRTTTRYKEDTRSYTYPVAESSQYSLELGANGFYEAKSDVTRNCNLEGRINLYLAPISKNKTQYSVNIRYVLKNNVTQSIRYEHTNNPAFIIDRTTLQRTITEAFSTNEKYQRTAQENDKFFTLSCGSKGTLEQKLLDLL